MKLLTLLTLTLLLSCSAPESLLKPDRRDRLIVGNSYPYLTVMKGSGRVKTIDYPCDTCIPGDF